MNSESLDIMDNVKLIENYKAYLLSSVSDLYMSMARGSKADMDEMLDEISETVIFAYMLARRLGINYSAVDERILKKLKLGVLDEDKIEREYQDYSRLISYIKDAREL